MKNKITIVVIASPGTAENHTLNILLGSHSKIISLGEISKIFGKADLRDACSLCVGECRFWGKFNKIWQPNGDFFSQLSEFSGKPFISVSNIGNFNNYLYSENITIKVIRLIRDGRAFTACTLQNHSHFTIDSIVQTWRNSSIKIDDWVSSFPSNDRLTLRYEDILSDKKSKLLLICNFIGIEFESSMLEYWKVKHHLVGVNKGNLSYVKQYLGSNSLTMDDQFYNQQSPDDFKDERWRYELDPFQLSTFERIAGKLNQQYGYESINIAGNGNSAITERIYNIECPKPDAECKKISNASVIIRSSGERTEDLCKELIDKQVIDKNIHIIKGVKPFSNALKKMFEIGLDSNLPWTIAVDADLLVLPNAISNLINIAENASKNVFEINTQMMDKFFGGPKDGGLHLFRTSLLDIALKQIPFEGFSSRPETFTIDRMQALGYEQIKNDMTLVLHDYEQYYRDIYRKSFFHGKKHKPFISEALLPLWERLSINNSDFKVAVWGYRASQVTDSSITSDIRLFGEEIDILLRAHGVNEKSPIPPDGFNTSDILNIIKNYSPSEEYLKFLRMIGKLTNIETNGNTLVDMAPPPRYNWRNHLINGLKEVGVVRFTPWFIGKALCKIGTILYKWSETR